MKFKPCIDLHDGRVKQIVGATLAAGAEPETNFVSERDAAWYAARYRADNLTGGHVIKLGPGNAAAARAALAAWPGGLQIGGGITADNAGEWLDAGAEKVIVTSFVFREGRLDAARLDRLVAAVGRDRLVLDLSCRKRDGRYFVVADRWQTFTELSLDADALGRLAKRCAEFLVHGVDVEGKRQGLDLELVALLADASPMPCTYAGGVRSLADLKTLRDVGRDRIDVTIGSALDLFGGTLSYSGVVTFCAGKAEEGREGNES